MKRARAPVLARADVPDVRTLASLARDRRRILVAVVAPARRYPAQAVRSVLVCAGPVDVEDAREQLPARVAKALGVSDVICDVRPAIVVEANTHKPSYRATAGWVAGPDGRSEPVER